MTNSPDPAGAILDDVDARPGSVTSLVRTVLGAHVRPRGGWCAIADFVRWMDALGVPSDSTRIAVARLKKKGVVESSERGGRSGYAITTAAEAMFARGDSRIFGFRRMADGDPWRLVSFAIPEAERAARHQLRRRLTAIGCGTVSPGLWIAPEYLANEVQGIVVALGLDAYVTTFVTAELTVPGTLHEAAASWWDLDDLEGRHRTFLARCGEVGDGPVDGEGAFVRFVTLLDEYRVIPYLDPGLPPAMTPDEWPGERSVAEFARARERYLEPSREWVGSSSR